MGFYKYIITLVLMSCFVPAISFAKEEKLKCDNVYLLLSNHKDLGYNIDPHVLSNGFLISARSCKIDLEKKVLKIYGETFAKLPLPSTSLHLKSLTWINVDLSSWKTVYILESVNVNGLRQTYLTIYGEIWAPLGSGSAGNVYMLLTPRFRYN